MAQTRKSSRVSIPTTKAKQFKETLRKPILRSISTIDEDENTYNNLSFKKRKVSKDTEVKTTSLKKETNAKSNAKLKEQVLVLESKNEDNDNSHGVDDEDEDEMNFSRGSSEHSNDYVNKNDDEEKVAEEEEEDDDEDDEDILSYSADDKLFNSDDDVEYYSAISDYEQDTTRTPSSYYSKSFLQDKIAKKTAQSSHIYNHHNPCILASNLFDHDDTTDASEVNSPIHSTFHYNDNDNVKELKSLEENFQRIIDENEKSQRSITLSSTASTSSSSSPSSIINPSSLSSPSSLIIHPSTPSQSISTTISKPHLNATHESLPKQVTETSTFVDYLSEDISSDESELKQFACTKRPKFLQYRHDERHNLAFPDVSTFPIRFDPLACHESTFAPNKRNKVRALKRRAILTGEASKMVGTGWSTPTFEFNIF